MAWGPYNLSFKILESRGGKVKVNIKNMDFEGYVYWPTIFFY